MFNIKIKDEHKSTTCYTESAQANPLRWQIMSREKDVLTSQASVMKCKDYFNDLVALRHGHTFTVYGFKNDTVTFNKWGLYILLTGIAKPDLFIENVNNSINTRMKEDLGTSIRCWKQPDNSVVIRIPNKVWENTYAVSLVTMMLRVCNNNIELNSWDDLYGDASPLNTVERSFTAGAKTLTKKVGFKAPIDTWYHYNTQYNGINGWTAGIGGMTIHNNGCSSWASGLPADLYASLTKETTEEVAA
jgi:hypothetical protein